MKLIKVNLLKFIPLFLMFTLIFSSSVLSANVKIVSESKYRINVSVLKGSSRCLTELQKQQALEGEGTMLGMILMFADSLVGDDVCETIGQKHRLAADNDNKYKSKSLMVPAGSIIIAYKDPHWAKKHRKKTVNGKALIFKAIVSSPDRYLVLKTNKGSGLIKDKGLIMEEAKFSRSGSSLRTDYK